MTDRTEPYEECRYCQDYLRETIDLEDKIKSLEGELAKARYLHGLDLQICHNVVSQAFEGIMDRLPEASTND